MASVATYTKSGAKASSPITLDKYIFDIETQNFDIIKLAYDAYLANGRENLAVTKTRGLVSGGGKKPWRQKGTGRARAGSTRSPLWRSGGSVFGPTGNENYSKKLPVTTKRLALRQALSLANSDGRAKVLEAFECKDGKVATTVKLLDKISAKGSVLIVVGHKDDLVERATRNLPNVKGVQANYLNVYDILNADTIVFEKKSLEIINGWLGEKK